MMKRKRTCGARNPFYVTPSLNEKYSRQMLFAGIGPEGQARLAGSSAVVVGCGAIGASGSRFLGPAGGGPIPLPDRDFLATSQPPPLARFAGPAMRGAASTPGSVARHTV